MWYNVISIKGGGMMTKRKFDLQLFAEDDPKEKDEEKEVDVKEKDDTTYDDDESEEMTIAEQVKKILSMESEVDRIKAYQELDFSTPEQDDDMIAKMETLESENGELKEKLKKANDDYVRAFKNGGDPKSDEDDNVDEEDGEPETKESLEDIANSVDTKEKKEEDDEDDEDKKESLEDIVNSM